MAIYLIPGGPLLPSTYLKPFENLLNEEYDIKYVDFSSPTTINKESVILHFVDELSKTIGSDPTPILIAHSFGSIIAMEFMLTHPKRIIGAVLSNAFPSFKKYNQNLITLLNQLPEDIRTKIEIFRQKRDYTPNYWELIFKEWYPRHGCLLPELPEDLNKSMAALDSDAYSSIVGEDLFEVTGVMSNWSIENLLPNIKTPSFFISGEYDTIFLEDIILLASSVKDGNFFLCPSSAHYPFYENPKVYFERINKFLDGLSN